MSRGASKTLQTLSLPGPESRVTWSLAGKSAQPLAATANVDPGRSAYGFGARNVISVPFWVNTADPSLIDQLVRVELERQKFELGHETGRVIDYRIVAEDGPRRQVEAAVLTPEAAASPACEADWARFDVAARYWPLPHDALVFFQEEGHWVAAFSRGDHLAYLHPLGRGLLDEDLIGETKCVYLQLHEQHLLPTLREIQVWTGTPPPQDVAELLERQLGAPVTAGTPPPPSCKRAGESPGFDPPTVALRRTRRLQRTRIIRGAVALGAAYAAVAIAGWLYLAGRERALRSSEAEIALIAPEARQVQDIQNRWDALQLAIEPERYPLEVFHQCALLLPAKGVRLTHFEVDGPRIIIRGEATTTGEALRYRNSLVSAPALAQYEWDSPKPDILPDNRAKFEAFGLLRGFNPES